MVTAPRPPGGAGAGVRIAAEITVGAMVGIIDRAALAAQTGGDADLAREVLALFAGQCRALLPPIADAGLPRARRADLAHTLKGSAAGIGAARVRDLADAVEARLRAGEELGEGPGRNLDGAVAALAAAVAAALGEIEAGA